jgi:hypothetical protein
MAAEANPSPKLNVAAADTHLRMMSPKKSSAAAASDSASSAPSSFQLSSPVLQAKLIENKEDVPFDGLFDFYF